MATPRKRTTAPRKKAATSEDVPELVPLATVDLQPLWQQAQGTRMVFMGMVRGLVSDPDQVDYIRFCYHCTTPGLQNDDSLMLDGAYYLCSDVCAANYQRCSECNAIVSVLDHFHDTGTCQDLCGDCRDESYFWCDDCDAWYANDLAGDHKHGDCDCPTYETEFSIRHGDVTLANDTYVQVQLPAGQISAEGISDITQYLRYDDYFNARTDPDTYRVSHNLEELGDQWQQRDGNYTKRLSRMAYKRFGVKIPPEMLSRVGDIAREHSRPVDFTVAITRELNMNPEEFCHSDSCWWQSYGTSRCALKSNGGFALRTFGPPVITMGVEGYRYPAGRAWVMPLRYDEQAYPAFRPTFETLTPDAFVVFNGYEELAGYNPARLLSHMVGWTYRKVAFSCDPMYVNSGGYLVAPEPLAHRYTDQSISLTVNFHSTLHQIERETANV